MKKTSWLLPLFVIVALIATGCGSTATTTSSDGTTTLSSAINGLEDVPDSSQMFKTNSASANIAKAVSGTAPLLKSITTTNADTYFWNGLAATIVGAGAATQSQAEEFWGATSGGAGGETACRMSQMVAYTMANIISSGTSLCYMRNMPNAASGVTLTQGDATAATIFQQAAADKVVKNSVTDPIFGNMTVFLKVYGSDSVGSSAYNVDLWFCDDSTVTGYDQIRINKATGQITTTSKGSHTENSVTNIYESSVTGYVTMESSSVVFDPTKDRTATFQFYSPTYGTMKSSITVNSSNQVVAQEYNHWTGGDTDCTNKNYSISGFSGTDLTTLRFNEAGVNGSMVCGDFTGTYQGGSEFQTTHYVATPTSTLATTAAAVSLTTGFYASAPSTPIIDTSAYSCSTAYDYAVTMDMSSSAPAQIAATCEAARFTEMSYCDGGNIAAARALVFASQQP